MNLNFEVPYLEDSWLGAMLVYQPVLKVTKPKIPSVRRKFTKAQRSSFIENAVCCVKNCQNATSGRTKFCKCVDRSQVDNSVGPFICNRCYYKFIYRHRLKQAFDAKKKYN